MKRIALICFWLVIPRCFHIAADSEAQNLYPPAGRPLSLAEAVVLAMERSPVLAAFPHQVRGAEARRIQAGQPPQAVLGLDFEDFLGSGAQRGVDNAQLTLSLSRVFELGGQRAARMQTAEAGRARVEDDYRLARTLVAAAVAAQFIHVAGDQLELALSREAVRLAEENLELVEERMQRAAASPLEAGRARIALARARIIEEHDEHELLTARRKLAAIWGSERADFGEVTADLFARPPLPEFETLASRVARSPEVARWAGEKSARDAEIFLARSRRRSNLTAGVGVRHFTGTDDVGLVLQLALPLGARSRAQPRVTEAELRRELAEAEQRETELQLRTALFGIVQELRHAHSELEALEREILPEAEAALDLAREGYARARLSQLELLDARRTLIELRRERIAAAVALHQYVVQIEKILGEPLSDIISQP